LQQQDAETVATMRARGEKERIKGMAVTNQQVGVKCNAELWAIREPV